MLVAYNVLHRRIRNLCFRPSTRKRQVGGFKSPLWDRFFFFGARKGRFRVDRRLKIP